MAWQNIEYAYPIAHVFHKELLWIDKDIRIYFAFKLNDSDNWTFFAALGSHALNTGSKLVQYATEAEAQTNYLLTSKNSNGKVLAVLPYNMQAKYARLYVETGQNVQIYEWHPSTYIAAHDIISGTLEITDQLSDAPLISVIKSGVTRVQLGNFDAAVYGLVGYDALGNKIFELSDSAQRLAGFSFTETALTAGSGGSAVGLAPADYPFYAGSEYGGRASAPFRVSAGGVLYATGAVISGTISATTGSIGGWSVTATEIKDAAGVVGLSSEATGSDDVRFWAGSITKETAPFRVYESGILIATSGNVGGWNITEDSLQSTLIGLHSASYGEGAEILLGHATEYASAKIGFKADGSGKFAGGNISWDTVGNMTFGGSTVSSMTITGGTIQTAASGARSVLDNSGLSVYDVSAQRALIGSDGAGWLGAITSLAWTSSGIVTIGGFTVDSTGMYTGTGSTRIQLQAGTGIWLGATSFADSVFSVSNAGALKATSGAIAGWSIDDSKIYKANSILHSDGYVSFGASPPTGYGNNVGAWLGYSSLLGKLSLYADATNYFQWDGAKLLVRAANFILDSSGNITANAGVIGGFSINSTEGLYAGDGATRVQMKPAAGIWTGATAIGSAPFSVTNAGVLTATSGTIAGWSFDASKIYKTNSILHSDGYVSFGATPPTSYGNNQGAWFGYSTLAKFSLYNDANNYLQWDGTKILIQAANFALDSSGNITANSGSIANFTFNTTDGFYYGSDATRIQLKPGNGLWLGATLQGAAPFAVTSAGVLTASSGTIAGWSFDTEKIYKTNSVLHSSGYISFGSTPPVEYGANVGAWMGYTSSKAKVSLYSTATSYFQWDGDKFIAKAANFEIDSSGNLSASSATLSGAITATSGNITGLLQVGSGTPHIHIDGTNAYIESSNYSSGPMGTGWRIDKDGQAQFMNIVARGKISCAAFEKDTVTVMNGKFMVCKGDVLASDMTALDSATLTIAGDTTFAVNEVLCIKDGTNEEWLLVTNIASAPTYTVTRDLAGAYGADVNPAWTKGAIVVSTGTTGNGFILLDASSLNNPLFSIFKRTGTTWNAYQELIRLGNLNGFLGYGSETYGIAIGDDTGHFKYDMANGIRVKGNIDASSITGGTITSALITGSVIQTATTGRRMRIDEDGIACISGSTTGQYGTNFQYGNNSMYGGEEGINVYINNPGYDVPIYEVTPGPKASLHFSDRNANPAGPNEVGDIAIVNGKLVMCSVAGSPGTWVVTGTQS